MRPTCSGKRKLFARPRNAHACRYLPSRLRQILALTSLVSGAALAQARPIVAGFERFHASDPAPASSAAGGLLLLNELNCVACHAAPLGWSESLPGRGKILLSGVGDRLSPEVLANFVRDPHAVKPGTLMPQIAARNADADRALVAYLGSLASTSAERTFPAGNAARGKRLFESVGCIACHGTPELAASYASVPLALAAHYERNALAAFLQNPLRLRPAGRMPSAELTETEAADVAEFLGAKNRGTTASPTPTAAAIAAGRAEFATRQCNACHDTGEPHVGRTATPLAQLRIDQGCLTSQSAAGTPRFNLSSAQTQAIAAALRRVQTEKSPAPPTAVERVSTRFTQLNCYACHEWRGKGGADAARAKTFTSSGAVLESLGELGRIPPNLDHTGRKLTPEWLEKLFWGTGGGVRPYMSVRMPRFGREAAADLVPLLAEACRPEKPLEIDTSGGKGHQRFATGRTLIGTGTGGIGCVTCHGIKDREPQGIRAINLTHTAQRLLPEFFKALLLDPQKLQPGTIMPPLLAGRPAAEKEVESIWTYFKELDQSPMLPEGLAIAGSFELKPAEEKRPIVFRTFLEGAGTQAIAVGNPAGLHAAFDSFEVHWALAWRGRYLDAQSNWEERPMKPIKPLGTDMQRFSPHMPLAQLSTASAPWPMSFGRQAEYVFTGYRLEPDGVPTFRYTAAGLTIEDTLRPTADGTALQRRVVVRGSGEGWFFRGLVPASLPQPLVWKNGTAVFEEILRF